MDHFDALLAPHIKPLSPESVSAEDAALGVSVEDLEAKAIMADPKLLARLLRAAEDLGPLHTFREAFGPNPTKSY